VSRRSGTLDRAEARRIALAAQGFDRARPAAGADRRSVRTVFGRLGVVQIDSVNVLVRSHELPLFSRLGAHPRDSLVAASWRGEAFEYWGHEASFLPVDAHPLLRHRMAAAADGAAWKGLVALARRRPGFVADVLAEVGRRGPVGAGEIGMGGGRTGPWWGWSEAKRALEYLFWTGAVTARRSPTFERRYELTERVVPAAVLAAPTPDPDDARRALLRRAAGALGVGTVGDLADYFRIPRPVARPLVADLVEDGALTEVRVEGWREPAYLDPTARLPRAVDATALVSPFDSLVWERARTERLFGFRYRLELYTPAERRVHGYYVLPFLCGDSLVARVDLRADRRAGVLAVLGAYAEPDVDTAAVAVRLAAELAQLAAWLGLDAVHVARRGDLARRLTAAVAGR